MLNYSSPFSNLTNLNGIFNSQKESEEEFDYFSSSPFLNNSQSNSIQTPKKEKKERNQSTYFRKKDNIEDAPKVHVPEIRIFLDQKLAEKNPTINIFYFPKKDTTTQKLNYLPEIKDNINVEVSNKKNFDGKVNFIDKRIGNISLERRRIFN